MINFVSLPLSRAPPSLLVMGLKTSVFQYQFRDLSQLIKLLLLLLFCYHFCNYQILHERGGVRAAKQIHLRKTNTQREFIPTKFQIMYMCIYIYMHHLILWNFGPFFFARPKRKTLSNTAHHCRAETRPITVVVFGFSFINVNIHINNIISIILRTKINACTPILAATCTCFLSISRRFV